MVTAKPTWQPDEEHGRLATKSDLPETVFAFPRQRKKPLTDARHVRNAVARFDQVIDVSDADRALAFANIEKAASERRKKATEKLSVDSLAGPGQHMVRARAESPPGWGA